MTFKEKKDFCIKVLKEEIDKHGLKEGIKIGKKRIHNENAGIETWVISLAIGILVLAYILPMAFTAFYSADVTKFCKSALDVNGTIVYTSDTTAQALWYLIPLLIIIGIIVYFATHRQQ